MNCILIILISMLTVSCGLVKGSSNPAIDKVIDNVNTNYPDDNFIEEKAEDIMTSVTGIDLDFSPRSPEESEE